jgi:hypothetical protein
VTEQKIRQEVHGQGDGTGWGSAWKIWEDQFEKLKQLVNGMDPAAVERGVRPTATPRPA